MQKLLSLKQNSGYKVYKIGLILHDFESDPDVKFRKSRFGQTVNCYISIDIRG